ncbi:unnamed protein product, partial [Mesorhabditis spiculigera]
MQKLLLATVALIGLATCQMGPWQVDSTKEAEFERMLSQLPPQLQAQAQAIHSNQALSFEQKHEQMHALIETLPADQRPMPPFMRNLPPSVQQQMRELWSNKALTWQQRRQQMHQLFQSLPESMRPHFPLPPFVNQLPEPYKSQWMAIHNQPGPGHFQKIRNLIATMPDSVKAQLPMQGRWGMMGKGRMWGQQQQQSQGQFRF